MAASGYAWDKNSPTTADCVTSLPSHISHVILSRLDGHIHLRLGDQRLARAGAGARDPRAARGSSTVATATAPTATNGWLDLTAGAKLAAGCYHVAVSAVRAAGYTWDATVPTTSLCVKAASLPKARRHHASVGR